MRTDRTQDVGAPHRSTFAFTGILPDDLSMQAPLLDLIKHRSSLSSLINLDLPLNTFTPFIVDAGFNPVTHSLLLLCKDIQLNVQNLPIPHLTTEADDSLTKREAQNRQKALNTIIDSKEFFLIYSVVDQRVQKLKNQTDSLRGIEYASYLDQGTTSRRSLESKRDVIPKEQSPLPQKAKRHVFRKLQALVLSDLWVGLGGTHGEYFFFLNSNLDSCAVEIGKNIRSNSGLRQTHHHHKSPESKESMNKRPSLPRSVLNLRGHKTPGLKDFKVLQKSEELVALAANLLEIHVWGIMVRKNEATAEKKSEEAEEQTKRNISEVKTEGARPPTSPKTNSARSASPSSPRMKPPDELLDIEMSHKYVLSFDLQISNFMLAEELKLLGISYAGQLLISLWNIGNEATPQQIFLIDELQHVKLTETLEAAIIQSKVHQFVSSPCSDPTDCSPDRINYYQRTASPEAGVSDLTFEHQISILTKTQIERHTAYLGTQFLRRKYPEAREYRQRKQKILTLSQKRHLKGVSLTVFDFFQEFIVIFNNVLLELTIWDICIGKRLRLINLEKQLIRPCLRSFSAEMENLFTGESDIEDIASIDGDDEDQLIFSKQASVPFQKDEAVYRKIKKIFLGASDLDCGIILISANGDLLNLSLLEERVVDTYYPNCSLQRVGPKPNSELALFLKSKGPKNSTR